MAGLVYGCEEERAEGGGAVEGGEQRCYGGRRRYRGRRAAIGGVRG